MTFLKPNEVAKILRVSVPTVRRLIQDGSLTAHQIGSQYRIDKADLTRFLQTSNRNSRVTKVKVDK